MEKLSDVYYEHALIRFSLYGEVLRQSRDVIAHNTSICRIGMMKQFLVSTREE